MVDSSYIEKKGVIRSVVFYNDNNGYSVANVEFESSSYTVVGCIPGIKVGKNYTFSGNWVMHKRYGEQFQVFKFNEIEPETSDEIEVFLASGIIKGIGPKTAKLIVKQFGEKSLDVIENSPERLMQVEGIGQKKWPTINQSYIEHRDFARIVLHFAGFDISPTIAKKLYDKYGAEAIEVTNNDPYIIIEDVPGIGFFTADAIAAKIGIKENNEQRIRSAVVFCLRKFLSEGSTYVPESKLIEFVVKLIDVTSDEIQDAIISLVFDEKIFQKDIDGENAIFLMLYYRVERLVCNELLRLQDANLKMITRDVEGLIAQSRIDLSDSQRKAIMASLDSGVFVITGGPGTGKTTILKTIINILTECGLNVAIAAPTGRAAKRITEATGYPSSTIHRLLDYSFGTDEEEAYYGRNSDNPLECDAIIIDEASMVDVLLMKALLQAIPSGTRFIIVGDADQLPPVGPGNVLRDILESGRISSAYLTEIFRQEGESNIVVGAHNINSGNYPEVGNFESDLFIIEKSEDRNILSSILKICKPTLEIHNQKYDFIKDVQVLTPVKKGMLGNKNLNNELQKSINPPSASKKEMLHAERIFRKGDRVMQIRNDYQKEWMDLEGFGEGDGVFNGDLGTISDVDIEEGVVKVLFDGARLAEYCMSELVDLELAYSVTVHKSQGSEFPVVVMPIFPTPKILATRNIIYTAVTRGIEQVILVGDKERLYSFVDNDLQRDRWSALSIFLKEYSEII